MFPTDTSAPSGMPPLAPQSAPPTTQKTVLQESHAPWYFSILLIVVVGVGSVALWGYNRYLTGEIATTKAQITEQEKKITDAQQDKNLLLAHILENTTQSEIKPSIDLQARLDDFVAVANESGVRFQGFAISGDTISTLLIAEATTTNEPDAVTKVIAMLRSHDKSLQILKVQPISAVGGDPRKRTTAIELKFSPPVPASVETGSGGVQ